MFRIKHSRLSLRNIERKDKEKNYIKEGTTLHVKGEKLHVKREKNYM